MPRELLAFLCLLILIISPEHSGVSGNSDQLPQLVDNFIIYPKTIVLDFSGNSSVGDLADSIKSQWMQLLPGEEFSVFIWNTPNTTTSLSEWTAPHLVKYVMVFPESPSAEMDIAKALDDFDNNSYANAANQTVKSARSVDTLDDQQTFTVVDSVWARGSLDIAPILEPFWMDALESLNMNVSNLKIIVLKIHSEADNHDNMTALTNGGSADSESTVRVVYLVVGDSEDPVDPDQARLKIRQVLAEELASTDIWTTPFQWSVREMSPRSTKPESSTGTMEASTVSLVNLLNFTDAILLTYHSDQQRDQATELCHDIWANLFELSLDDVAVHLQSETIADPVGSKREQSLVHEVVLSVVLKSQPAVSWTVEKAKEKFRMLLDRASSNLNVEESSSEANSDESSDHSTWRDLSFVDVYELQTSNTAQDNTSSALYVQMIFDEVAFANISKTNLRNVTDIFLTAWKDIVDNQTSSLKLAVDAWREKHAAAASMILSYALVIRRTDSTPLDPVKLLTDFRAKMTKQTSVLGSSFTFPDDGSAKYADIINIEVPRYAIFDVVSLAYGTDFVPNASVETLRLLWTTLLGTNAQDVTLDVYRVSGEVSFSLAGDNGLPISKLYFRVVFSSTASDWNTTALRVQFRAALPSIRNSSLLFSVVPIAFLLPTTIVSTTPLPVTASMDSSTDSSTSAMTQATSTIPLTDPATIKESIIFCYPNETERNRHLSALRQIWADALGQAVFDVRLTVLQDTVLNNSLVNSTLIVHEVTYVVVPSTSHTVDIPAARAKFDILQANSTDFNQENCTSDAAAPSNPVPLQGNNASVNAQDVQTWNLSQSNGSLTVCSYTFYATVTANSTNHTAVVPTAWSSSSTPDWRNGEAFLFSPLAQFDNNKSEAAAATREIPYGVTVISANCSLSLDALQIEGKSILGGTVLSSATFVNSTNNGTNSTVAPHTEQVVYVILDSIKIANFSPGNLTDVLRGLNKAWQYAVGRRNSSADIKIDLLDPAKPPVASSEPVILSYVVRIITADLNIDLNFVRQKLSKEVRRRGFVYGLYVVSDGDDTATTTVMSSTASTPQFTGVTQASAKMINSGITDTISLQYSSDAERDLALEELRKLWALALNSSLSFVTLNLKSETTLAVAMSGNVYQLKYVITDSSPSPSDPTTAKRTFDRYLNRVYGTFMPNSDPVNDAAQLNSDTVTTAPDITTTVPDVAKTPLVFTYVLYDEMRLTYTDATDRDQALLVFERIWTDTIGRDKAGLVRLLVYQEFPPYSNDTTSTGIIHTMFYVIAIASDLSNLDLNTAKAAFRKRVLNADVPYIVNFAHIYPSPQPKPSQALMLIDDSFSSSPNRAQSSELGDSLVTLYKSALGGDLQQVNAWNYSIAPPVSPDNVTAVLPLILNKTVTVVLIITNNTALTTDQVQRKLKDTLIRISLVVIRNSGVTASPDNQTEIPDSVATVLFRQATRLSLAPSDNRIAVMEELRNAWEQVLKPSVTNVTIHDYRNGFGIGLPAVGGPVLQPSDGGVLQYVVQGVLTGSLLNLTAARRDFAKLTENLNGLFRSTTVAPPTVNVLFP